jgi:hypothetical protein
MAMAMALALALAMAMALALAMAMAMAMALAMALALAMAMAMALALAMAMAMALAMALALAMAMAMAMALAMALALALAMAMAMAKIVSDKGEERLMSEETVKAYRELADIAEGRVTCSMLIMEIKTRLTEQTELLKKLNARESELRKELGITVHRKKTPPEPPKKVGRPKGSKNKGKTAAPASNVSGSWTCAGCGVTYAVGEDTMICTNPKCPRYPMPTGRQVAQTQPSADIEGIDPEDQKKIDDTLAALDKRE